MELNFLIFTFLKVTFYYQIRSLNYQLFLVMVYLWKNDYDEEILTFFYSFTLTIYASYYDLL